MGYSGIASEPADSRTIERKMPEQVFPARAGMNRRHSGRPHPSLGPGPSDRMRPSAAPTLRLTLRSDMRVGYVILGTLWAASAVWFWAMGFTDEFAPAVMAGLVLAMVLTIPVAMVIAGVAGTWRAARAIIGAFRGHTGAHRRPRAP